MPVAPGLQKIAVKGSGFLRLVPLDVSGSTITNVDATNKIDILDVLEEMAKYPDTAPKLESKTAELSTGYEVQVPITKKILLASTGDWTDESLEYSFEVKCILSKATFAKILAQANAKKPFFAIKGKGWDVSGNHIGYQYLIGYATGVEYPTKADINQITISIKGGYVHTAGTGIDITDFNAVTGTGNEVTPYGFSPLTITALDASDLPNLLAGKIIDKGAP
jgi:hypothetical protein